MNRLKLISNIFLVVENLTDFSSGSRVVDLCIWFVSTCGVERTVTFGRHQFSAKCGHVHLVDLVMADNVLSDGTSGSQADSQTVVRPLDRVQSKSSTLKV